MTQRKPLSTKLHATDPYEGFDTSDLPLDLQGWGAENPLFGQLVKLLKPSLIVEVGTWKGRSAVHMASEVIRNGLDTEIVCIDTFLGSWEHWCDERGTAPIAHTHGRPVLYDQFLSNVIQTNLTNIITPLPLDSGNAATLLGKLNVQAELVYIDADHEFDGVLRDIEAYWPLVKEGGVLFGDDFVQEWPGVIQAVVEFTTRHGLEYATVEEKWYIQKPAAS